jgi:hypothetical protein
MHAKTYTTDRVSAEVRHLAERGRHSVVEVGPPLDLTRNGAGHRNTASDLRSLTRCWEARRVALVTGQHSSHAAQQQNAAGNGLGHCSLMWIAPPTPPVSLFTANTS